MADKIETEATILSVEDDASWKYSIEADIPAFDGDRSYRYLAWNKNQGPPPQVGAVGLGTFEPYQRAKFYVSRGDISDGPVDGTEKSYMVTWNMVGFAAGATNGTVATQPTTTAANNAAWRSSGVSGAAGTTYLPAPTADERLAKELAKFRREAEGVNDRKAVSDVLAMGESGIYTLDTLIQDAEKLAQWYNKRLSARCESPLVQAAQGAGAVVTKVDEAAVVLTYTPEGPPPLKNKAELSEWVTTQGWGKEDISRVLQDGGFASSNAYLQTPGNTVHGLASLLSEKLGW